MSKFEFYFSLVVITVFVVLGFMFLGLVDQAGQILINDILQK